MQRADAFKKLFQYLEDMTIGVECEEQPWRAPPHMRKRPCIYQFFNTFSPKSWVSPNTFEKSTPVDMTNANIV